MIASRSLGLLNCSRFTSLHLLCDWLAQSVAPHICLSDCLSRRHHHIKDCSESHLRLFFLRRPSNVLCCTSYCSPQSNIHWSTNSGNCNRSFHRSIINMMPTKVARAARPKLSLSIQAATQSTQRVATPVSPSPLTPTSRNTRANKRGISTMQNPTYAYPQNAGTKSILRRRDPGDSSRSSPERRIQFNDQPEVHCITPVSWEDGEAPVYLPMKEDRRWTRRLDD